MKTAIVLSDTHGNKKDLYKLEGVIGEADHVFHLGDGYYDLNVFGNDVLKKTTRVKGNCDAVNGDIDRLIEIEGVKIYLTHGDLYGAKRGVDKLYYKAKEVGADVVFYGHSHVAKIDEYDGVTIANPGTITRYSTKKTFIYAVFHEGKFTLKINENTLF
ncbi:MAG: metallophosphoesterase [Clostridia bacterium]|nr:metallophosphoesterase [Clostridia bacterium]MBP5373062.1 metallophosphoesterase [Clostridia bacterium]